MDARVPDPEMPTPDDYRKLGITATSSDAEVKRAFRRIAKDTHPDAGTSPDPARFDASRKSCEKILAYRERFPGRESSPCAISSMPLEVTMWCSADALLVAPSRECFLDPAATVTPIPSAQTPLEVLRTSFGYECVVRGASTVRIPISPRAERAGIPVWRVGLDFSLDVPSVADRFTGGTMYSASPPRLPGSLISTARNRSLR